MKSIRVMPLLASIACASTTAATDGPKLEEETPMTAETADPPFTAEQIREACPAGTSWAYEIRQLRKPMVRQVTVVEGSTEVEMTFVQTSYNEGGERLGLPKNASATWLELESHARFPKAMTTVAPATIETPLGTFEGWTYTVKQPSPERVHYYHFAKKFPGPPVLFEQHDKGEVVFRMVRVE